MKSFLDKHLRTLISKKLLVWVVATLALYSQHLGDDNWTMITMGYVGSQDMIDAVRSYKYGGKS